LVFLKQAETDGQIGWKSEGTNTMMTHENHPATAGGLLDRDMLEGICRAAGADDIGFVELGRSRLSGQRDGILRAIPWAKSFMVFVRRLNRHAIRSPMRSISSAEFAASGHDVKEIVHRTVRDLEDAGVRALGLSGLFPFEFSRSDGPPFVVPLKVLAEEAGLGLMGKNRMVLHPRFGADIYLGAIALDRSLPEEELGRPLPQSPCIDCNMCAVACPTGAIAKDGHFDFGSCMTHNYREKVGGFVEWVHTLADSRNRQDYRRRVSDAETLSWWQSLGYEANTHCDYCVAVCPAGTEAASFLADRKPHFRDVVGPFRERVETVYVVPGSDAEAYVSTTYPHKQVRRIGSGRSPASIASLIAMLPLVFQRGRAEGVAGRYHFRFHGKETMDATVDIRDQRISVIPGLDGGADLEVSADSEAWLGFLRRERRLVWEMVRGRIRLRGSPTRLKEFGRCFPG
jgi:ferredoxin